MRSLLIPIALLTGCATTTQPANIDCAEQSVAKPAKPTTAELNEELGDWRRGVEVKRLSEAVTCVREFATLEPEHFDLRWGGVLRSTSRELLERYVPHWCIPSNAQKLNGQIDELLTKAEDGEIALKEVDTSSSELALLKKDFYQRMAKAALRKAESENSLDYLKTVHVFLNEGGVRPREIGSSREDLYRLRRRGYLARATIHFERWKRSPLHLGERSRMIATLEIAGATPEELGASEEEIKQLERVIHLKVATVVLEEMRRSGGIRTPVLIQVIRFQLGEADASLADIGTSKEELQHLVIPEQKTAAQDI